MKVRVYYNLHKKLFSVQEKKEKGWRVVSHVKFIALHNVKFKVSEAGRKRVLAEKKKNVHAFVEGEFFDGLLPNQGDLNPVRYNPYVCGTFTLNDKPIHKSKYIEMHALGKPKMFVTL